MDPANVHGHAFRLLYQGEALVQQSHVAEASQVIGDVVTLTATNTSRRIDQRITELRAALEPWRRTKPVRELDELLMTYSRSPRVN